MKRLGLISGTVAVLLGGLAAAAHAAQPPTRPALFRVGAAAESIMPPPTLAVYDGGFGQGPAITGDPTIPGDPGDDLEARALYVSNGTRAVALVVVDSQGLFAAYQQDPDLGVDAMRRDAAAAVDRAGAGPAMAAQDIIVQGSHSHSAPTSMGIWGPVPTAYLREIHDQVVRAIETAAQRAQPAHLRFATIAAPDLDNWVLNQTDSYEGWQQDGQVSVLWAQGLNGATIATYANVPAHPDIVNGASLYLLTADYFGDVRQHLEQQLGGTSIVGGATLGREESPVQVGGVQEMQWYADVVTNRVDAALAHAQLVTDPTVGSAETFLYVPGSNPLLLGLVLSWGAPQQVQDAESSNAAYPIDRADTPPYQAGAVLGTPVTALRIGRLAYVSLNGEAFPEIRYAIASAVSDAAMLVGLSLGNDQLGYYEPAFAWAFANGEAPYHSDHLEYNVSPFLGDELIQAQIHNLELLGFTTLPVAPPKPLQYDFAQAAKPGVQALAAPSGSLTLTFQGFYGDSALWGTTAGQVPGAGNPYAQSGPLHWDFGDGTQATTAMQNDRRSVFIAHTYARPGSYTVHIWGFDQQGDRADWTLTLSVTPRLITTVQAHPGT